VNQNVILCGLPKSGKTTVGEELAKWLELKFIDTDRCIELACGKQRSCRDIFIQEGEAYFRELEWQQIINLACTTGAVISLGGGALATTEIQRFVRALGVVIYLNAPLQEVWGRLMHHGMPAYVDVTDPWEGFVKMAQQRIPIYERTAHQVIETSGLTVLQTVERIVQNSGLGVAHGK
jgi:shikimate kinase